MSIRLQSLNVKRAGPLSSITIEFNDITLIYGYNETGKTYLTEFLLQSLFSGFTGSRNDSGAGQVICKIDDRDIVAFTPGKKVPKIEAHILPPGEVAKVDLVHLFTVRGGIVHLKEGGKLQKSDLRKLLADQALGEIISIGLNQSCEIVNGAIRVKDERGKNARIFKDSKSDYEEIRNLLFRIEEQLSLGVIKNFEKELGEIQEKRDFFLREKKKIAGAKKRRIDEIDKKLRQYTDKDLDDLTRLAITIDTLKDDINSSLALESDLKTKSDQYKWLDEAIRLIETEPHSISAKSTYILLGLVACGIITGTIYTYSNLTIALMISGISLLLLVLTGYTFRRILSTIKDQMSTALIFEDYKTRFGKQIFSLASLNSTLKEYKVFADEYLRLTGKIDDKRNSLQQAEDEFKSLMIAVFGKTLALEDLVQRVKDIQADRKSLSSERKDLSDCLLEIGIGTPELIDEVSEYKLEDVEAELIRLESKIRDLNQKILQSKNDSDDLYQSACGAIRAKDKPTWDVIIDGLREEMRKRLLALKDIKSVIYSHLITGQVISEMKQDEDKIIDASLASPQINQPIRDFTPYASISCEGESVFVDNPTAHYPLEQLSTGTQEQVLMALRVGLANHILRGEKMFFILDDAFQHSDYPRREKMVRQLGLLAHAGWQIVYFTMDDHIRSLFEKIIAPDFMDRYQYKELHPDIAS